LFAVTLSIYFAKIPLKNYSLPTSKNLGYKSVQILRPEQALVLHLEVKMMMRCVQQPTGKPKSEILFNPRISDKGQPTVS
jgi:hypothetical protein